jgi:uncharacterized sulfatase
MNRLRPFVFLFASGLLAHMSGLKAQDTSADPNIVMILSDDQAWTDYGMMGHPDIRTPHLDRLAARSATFKRGYTPVPLCRPSLLSMITGRYPHQHGVTGNDPRPDKSLGDARYGQLREQLISKIDRQATLPKLLASKNYLSMQSGKWWEGNFSRGGFTHGMTRGFPQKGGRHGDDGLEIGRKGLQPVFDFIQHATDEKKPFFLWYAPMLPHTPHNPPERLLVKYQKPGRPEVLAKYYAMCEFFDETCGELLNHLDEKKLTENTIVVYFTDNGCSGRSSRTGQHDRRVSNSAGGDRAGCSGGLTRCEFAAADERQDTAGSHVPVRRKLFARYY